MKITIIIPCYNAEKYIEECFDSICRQTMSMEELQIIFVNDASTDQTLRYLNEFQQKYPQSVTVIDLKENHRQGGARNEGLKYARGEYVAFLDADDWLNPCMCEKTYDMAKKNDIDIVQFPFVHVYPETTVTDTSTQYGFLDGTVENIKRGLLLGLFLTFGSQNKLYRRQLLEETNAAFLEGVVYEEPYFVYPLLLKAKRFFCMKEGMYYYRQTSMSVTGFHMMQKKTLYDHPYVQMELLKKLVREKYVEKYYEEIELHFLYSYYMETIYFAGKSNLYLDREYFTQMQKNVKNLFPEYKVNQYMNLQEFGKLKEVILSIEEDFSQEKLIEYCKKVVKIMEQ